MMPEIINIVSAELSLGVRGFLNLPAPQRKIMREMILLVAKACEVAPKT